MRETLSCVQKHRAEVERKEPREKKRKVRNTGRPHPLQSATIFFAATTIHYAHFLAAFFPPVFFAAFFAPFFAAFGEAFFGDAAFGDAAFGEPFFGDAFLGEAFLGEAFLGEAFLGEAAFGDAAAASIVEVIWCCGWRRANRQ